MDSSKICLKEAMVENTGIKNINLLVNSIIWLRYRLEMTRIDSSQSHKQVLVIK